MKIFTKSITIIIISVITLISASSLKNKFYFLIDGPGLGKLTYTDAELYKPIFTFKESNGAKKGHSSVAMHNGYLVIPGGRDSGLSGGGFAAFDVSNPKDPKLVISKFDTTTNLMREAHTIGFSDSYPGSYAVMQTVSGVIFWDWTDIANPKILNALTLPGVQASDYTNGAWWLSWQAPYLYVGGGANGIYIVDSKDPKNPKLLAQIPKSKTGGFNVGPVFTVGNLLISSMPENGDISILDISNPVDPKLISKFTAEKNYSTMVNGNKIYCAGTDGRLYGYDFSDPKAIKFINKSEIIGGKGGYLNFQDGHIFMGASSNMAKIDVRNNAEYKLIFRGGSNITNRDEDFAVPLGNLVFVGNDHENGSVLIPHQKDPDLNGPDVTMAIPSNNSINQALTSRIGVTMSDNIDLRSVNNKTFIVRPIGGTPIAGKYGLQTGILNFCPDNPLSPNTVYEVLIPKNGIEDISGNKTKVDFYSKFSTGSSINIAPIIEIISSGPQEVNKVVNFEARRINTTGGGTTTYTWNFGDGTPLMVTANNKVSHTYTKPNQYTVSLEAKDNISVGNDTSIQTIYLPISLVKPTNSSTVIYDEANNRVWNTNPDSNTITISDAITHTKIKELNTGKRPRCIAKAPDSKIWVTNQDDSTISIFSNDGTLAKTVKLPHASQPFGLTFSPNNLNAYVTLQATGRLLKLNADGLIQGSIPVGPTPRGIAITNDSKRIFITRFISPENQGEVVEIDGTLFSFKRKIILQKDIDADTETSGRGIPNYLNSITINPNGNEAWVVGKKDNTFRGKFVDGQALTFESTVRSIACRINLNTNTELINDRIDLDNRDSPTAVIFSKLGNYALITTQGNDLVEIRDAYVGRSVATIENSGSAPNGVVLSPDGNKLFVNNFISRSVTVFDISKVIQSINNNAVKLAEIKTVAAELLPAEVLRGKKIFYSSEDRMSEGNYISCATCHVDGGGDGRVWDFTDRGEGLRNTTSLIGRSGMGHGRVHWSGNFDEIQDFENDIRNSFKGTGFMTDADFKATSNTLGKPKKGLSPDLDALAAYISSLTNHEKSPFKKEDGTLTSSAIAGKNIFEKQQCAACHSGNNFTDSDKGNLHDVGTISIKSGGRLGKPLLGIDVPTLRGVWSTAPYLHDGSAATLEEVFTSRNKEDKHGITSTLTRTELGQLVAYLKQIDDVTPASSAESISLKLTSPINATVFDIGSNVTFNINTNIKNISEVVYYANGNEVARSKVAPYNAQWKGLAGMNYEINAKVFHGKMASVSQEVSISYKAETTNFFSSVTPSNSSPYKIVKEITPNMQFRIDRTFTVEEVIEPFRNAEIILNANADKAITLENFVKVQISKQGIVYIGYDPRATSIPNWLKSWTKTNLIFKTSDVDFIVYEKNVTAGELTLGGNLAAGAVGANSNYVIIGKPSNFDGKLTSPANNSEFDLNSNINFSTSISQIGSGALTVEYFANHYKIGASTTAPNYSFDWKSSLIGNFEVYAVITDSNGNKTTANINNVKINGVINQKPTVVINNPLNNTIYQTGQTFSAQVSANDMDGTVNKVEYFLNDIYIGNSLISPFNYTFSIANTGNYVLTAIATDNNGNKSDVSFGVDLIINTPLNITDFSSDENFKIYPNPAIKDFIIFNNNGIDAKQILIYNIHGENLNFNYEQISDKEILIDVSNFSSGLYLVNTNNKEAITRKKLIIVKQ